VDLPTGPTSLTLLVRLRAADPDDPAWDRLVALYGPVVEFWCRRAGVSPADVDDVRQETFAAVATSVAEFRRDRQGDTFRGWLFRVTRNKVTDHFRRRNRCAPAAGGTDAWEQLEQTPDPAADLPEDPPEVAAGLYHRGLELVRSEFEPQTWAAFWRTAVDDLPVDLTAADLGVTPAAVRKAKSRVLRRLREELGDVLD
jgi:RNA polymerase sigma-70 factor (ECF subfamily)